MLRSIVLVAALTSMAAELSAAVTQFPYEAVVTSDDIDVRSGPGKNYYATSRLQRNDRVVVHRHDPGGWYMISPPPGSVSWIDASQVERSGNHGIVTVPADDEGRPGQAVVHIGSSLSDDHAYTGRQLSNGDEVTILGEEVLSTEAGSARMLKILPPAREYRWVKGDFIVPLDLALRQQIDRDPYAVPSTHRESNAVTPVAGESFAEVEAEPDNQATASSLRAPRETTSEVRESAGAEEHVSPGRLRLLEIDGGYRDMVERNVLEWRLDEVRSAYAALRAESPELAGQIDSRMQSLETRQKFYDAHATFANLTAQTNQREAQLLATGSGIILETGAGTPAVDLGIPAAQPTSSVTPASGTEPSTLPSLPSLSSSNLPAQVPVNESAAIPTPLAAAAPIPQPKLDGAGILQAVKSPAAGIPKYMLVAPDGRFLTFVESRDYDLNQYLGQSLGLIGKRGRDPRLQADVIQVRQMMAVQLTP
jgi:hypothetical protein